MASDGFHPAVAAWFATEFAAPTAVQQRAWSAIAAGEHTLISAPTGSGKTLAAFMSVIDRLVGEALAGTLADQTYALYVSPLKALSNDVQKNLQAPLSGIRRELLSRGLPDAPIRAWVRTGDTPQSERARMRQRPPHILVTTPESLYILLGSESGRRMLSTVRTVVVDEVHALAGNKRGAHLGLSLERLAALVDAPLARVGISATTRPIERMAEFLLGAREEPCTIIDQGHVRELDLALELPGSALEAVMSNEVWAELYDRLASLASEHRTTLIFVNTRRLAERLARHLADRLGEERVTAHHGSLAKEHRQKAEQRLKAGELKALVATASLELGIDIGDVDLVCQIGSPRGIATLLQRVGRSGHGLGRVPKGRVFPLSRDELVECAALLDAVRRHELDAIEPAAAPLDVLAQQVVAEVAMREWSTDGLYGILHRAACYRSLDRDRFVAVVQMLAEGFSTHRGRRAAHLHHDRVNGSLRARRSARLTALTNGGVIPDLFDYDVLLQPAEQSVGTLNEDFAFESLPGDIFQLGNTSYRILKIEPGRVHVADAHGEPPNMPFWVGEAPGRSDELSAAVSRLRERLDRELEAKSAAELATELAAELGLSAVAAGELVEYLAAARAALGGLPSARRVVLERFFDEAGDAHLVVHSSFGSRVNRAWGLALRKRFCRRFNFELQAAALEDSIVISLGAVHSFPLVEVAGYLKANTVEDVLSQAVLTAPVFPGRWRWNATTALAVRRFHNGKRAPAQFQRSDAEDLLATVFPDQLACAENLAGEREIPDHPLVAQTLRDCLEDVMDLKGLERVLARIEAGEIEIVGRELTSPSPLAQEILAAKPYAFLDDAPAEERRTLAVQARRYLSVEQAAELGRLDPEAILRVKREAWPDPRDPDELNDALSLLGFAAAEECEPHWQPWLETLAATGRATSLTGAEHDLWASAERLPELQCVLPAARARRELAVLGPVPENRDAALVTLLASRLESLGPVTARTLAGPLGVPVSEVEVALGALEAKGVAMRGRYSGADVEEWCERRLLARIHRYTLNRLRSEIEPVSLADYQRFLFHWQGLGEERRCGTDALRVVLAELEGVVLPAAAWEREVLPQRISDYAPELIDALTQSGDVVWWRPRSSMPDAPARASSLASAPIALLPRPTMIHWRLLVGSTPSTEAPLSHAAGRVIGALEVQGALFFVELVEQTGLLRVQVEEALSELAALGLVTADAFAGLRALVTPPSRRRGFGRSRRYRSAPSLDSAGRWARVKTLEIEDWAAARAAAVEHAARTVLKRYGVVARAVLGRETALPPWRELVACFRRWEARGEIRGGRFVAPLGGEQFALGEALETLRSVRRTRHGDESVVLSAADPLNLVGVLGAGARVPALASHRVLYEAGVPVAASGAHGLQWLAELGPEQRARASSRLGSRDAAPRLARRRQR